MIEVYRPGIRAQVDGLQSVIITAVQVEVQDIQYRCEWWSDGRLIVEWFHPSRITSEDPPIQMGFVETLRPSDN